MNITQSSLGPQSLSGTGRYDHDSLFEQIGLKNESMGPSENIDTYQESQENEISNLQEQDQDQTVQSFQDQSLEQSQNLPKEILRISIQMGEGQENEIIVLRENESISDVAQEFTSRFGLGMNAAVALENQMLAALGQQKQPIEEYFRGTKTEDQNLSDIDHDQASENINDDTLSEENFSREELVQSSSRRALNIPTYQGGSKGNRIPSSNVTLTHQNLDLRQPLNASGSSLQYYSNYTGQDRGAVINYSHSKKSSNSKSFNKIGDRMFYQAQILRENKERLIKQFKDEEEQLFQQHSFKPQLISKQKAQNYLKPQDSITLHQQAKLEHISRLKQERDEQILSECQNFMPKLCKKSKKIVEGYQENVQENEMGDRFQILYNHAMMQQQNKLKIQQINYDEECTFKPKLKAKSSMYQSMQAQNEQKMNLILRNKSVEILPEFPGVWQRMNESIENFKRIKKMRENPAQFDLFEKHDPQTGQVLFKPQLLSKNHASFRGNSVTAGEDLYKNAQLLQQKKLDIINKKKVEDHQQLINLSQYKSNNKSDKIFKNKLKTKLSEIFDQFDLNGNGKISADEINLDSLPVEILSIFKPLLIEMESYAEDLDREEFVESALCLLEKLDIGSRNQVINYGKKIPKSLQNLSNQLFKPIISKKSKELVQNRAPLTERFAKQQYDREQKLELLKKQKEWEELQDCTFTPQTIDYYPASPPEPENYRQILSRQYLQ